MKARKGVVVFLGIVCLLVGSVSLSYASEYLGEYCFNSNLGVLYRLGVTHMGNGHYLVNGKSINSAGLAGALHGNAEGHGNSILLTMTWSSGNSQYGYVTHADVTLDPYTLNGWAYVMGERYTKATNTYSKFTQYEYLTWVACP